MSFLRVAVRKLEGYRVGGKMLDDRDRIGGGFVGVVSPRRSAFGHQITSAAPITGLRPDIKSAWLLFLPSWFQHHH